MGRFEEYSGLQELVEREKKGLIAELNRTILFTTAVRGYKEMGLIYTDARGSKKGELASHHFDDGSISDIVDYCTAPDITLVTTEELAMAILARIEWVKEHQLMAFFTYAPHLKGKELSDKLKMVSLLRKVPLLAITYLDSGVKSRGL